MVHRDNAFVIKVWDLLRNPWRLDTIEFNHLMIDDIDGLSKEGISWTLILQWVNDGSVKIIIKHAIAVVSDICDLSGEEYDRIVEIKNFDARFSTDVHGEDKDRVYDELFPLDPQWETINIYDLLLQSIQLQDPIVHIKPDKEYLLDEYDADEGDYEDKDLTSGNVLFH
jgi:hypothetical protein